MACSPPGRYRGWPRPIRVVEGRRFPKVAVPGFPRATRALGGKPGRSTWWQHLRAPLCSRHPALSGRHASHFTGAPAARSDLRTNGTTVSALCQTDALGQTSCMARTLVPSMLFESPPTAGRSVRNLCRHTAVGRGPGARSFGPVQVGLTTRGVARMLQAAGVRRFPFLMT